MSPQTPKNCKCHNQIQNNSFCITKKHSGLQILMIRKYFSPVIFEENTKIIINPSFVDEKEIRMSFKVCW